MGHSSKTEFLLKMDVYEPIKCLDNHLKSRKRYSKLTVKYLIPILQIETPSKVFLKDSYFTETLIVNVTLFIVRKKKKT